MLACIDFLKTKEAAHTCTGKKAREVGPKQRGRKLCLLKDKFQYALRFSKRVGLKLSQVELNNDKGALTYLNGKMKACKS